MTLFKARIGAAVVSLGVVIVILATGSYYGAPPAVVLVLTLVSILVVIGCFHTLIEPR